MKLISLKIKVVRAGNIFEYGNEVYFLHKVAKLLWNISETFLAEHIRVTFTEQMDKSSQIHAFSVHEYSYTTDLALRYEKAEFYLFIVLLWLFIFFRFYSTIYH